GAAKGERREEAGAKPSAAFPRAERRRSRSASRERERRRRERSRSRERDRRRSRSRSPHRRRSRSPRRHRSSSSSPPRLKERRDEEKKEIKDSKSKERQITEADLQGEDLQGKTEEEIEMMKTMGFASFDTTKGKKVDGAANAYAINVSQKRKYRFVLGLWERKRSQGTRWVYSCAAAAPDGFSLSVEQGGDRTAPLQVIES
ncbi:PREDICTED: U4/U6.U5 small nuclear ribonucleoprotein 27 kDa protein, partial [Aptenodytes forsteri]